MQQAALDHGKGAGRAARGRKDSEGQDAVIKPQVIEDRVDELVELHDKAAAAGEIYAEAVKKAAEDSGLLSSVVRKFVAARAGEKFDEVRRRVEQLSLLFDEVGD